MEVDRVEEGDSDSDKDDNDNNVPDLIGRHADLYEGVSEDKDGGSNDEIPELVGCSQSQ